MQVAEGLIVASPQANEGDTESGAERAGASKEAAADRRFQYFVDRLSKIQVNDSSFFLLAVRPKSYSFSQSFLPETERLRLHLYFVDLPL